MKPTIVLIRNPLNVGEKEVFEVDDGTLIIDWLQDVAPEGFGYPIRVFVNQAELEIEDLDTGLTEDQVCVIAISPAVGFIAALGYLWVNIVAPALIQAAIGLAIAFAMNALFGPSKPKNRNYESSPTYDIGATRNQERLGAPIELIYGKDVLTVPSFAAAPYTFYSQTGSSDQYLDSLFCIGQGEFEPLAIDGSDIYFGDTPASDMPPGTVQFIQFQSGAAPAPVVNHLQQWGTITAATWANDGFGSTREYRFLEDCHTCPSVTDWEFNSDESDPSTLNRSGSMTFVAGIYTGQIKVPSDWSLRAGQKIVITGTANNNGTYWIRYVTPDETSTVVESDAAIGNVYATDILTVSGTIAAETTTGTLTTDFVTSNAEAGPYIATPLNKGVKSLWFDFVSPRGVYRARSSGKYQYPSNNNPPKLQLIAEELASGSNTPSGAAPITKTVTYNHNRPDPVRHTFVMDASDGIQVGKRYRVTVKALHQMTDSQKIENGVTWTALRSEIDHTGETLYGRTTILAVRVKATNGISGQASSQLKVRAKRKYKLLDGSIGVSSNPANIVYDMYCSKAFGLGRPETEINRPVLEGLRNLWDKPGTESPVFNGVFDTKNTAWEALEQALSIAVARPAIDAGQFTIIADKKKPFTQFVFNNANIVKGSFQANYLIDNDADTDGIEVQYRDKESFKPAFTTYPALTADGVAPINPQKVELFGSTSRFYATKYAALMWDRRTYSRKTASFETELQGMIPAIGDRILVSTPVTKWGQSGRVVNVKNAASANPTLVLDSNIDWTVTRAFMVLTDADGNPSDMIVVEEGPTKNEAKLINTGFGTAPPVDLSTLRLDLTMKQDPPTYTLLSFVGSARAMVVTQIDHTEGLKFKIAAQDYSDNVFKNAPLHLSLDNTGAPL